MASKNNISIMTSKKLKNCRGKHGLKEFNTNKSGFSCDACKEHMSKGDKMFGCRFCNYDLCPDCMNESNHTDNDQKNAENDEKKEQIQYKVNNNGSVTFYPTTNIKRGTKKFQTTKFTQSRKCANDPEGVFDYKKEIISGGATNCAFINCCELAYAQHYPLFIKPEHIFLLITQAIAIHVDKNAETLRHKYVNHKTGKKPLIVYFNKANWKRKSPNNDWSGVIKSFVQQIDQNSKKDIVPLFDANFSSTTLTEKIAAKITLMATCKNYFEYRMAACICGFPEITLGGNVNDWKLLKEKVTKLLTDKVNNRFGEQWKKSLLPVLDRFIAAFSGDISMVFWNSMVYKGQWYYMKGSGAYGMGGPYTKHYKTFISGWINVFFPFIGDKNYGNYCCFEPYSGDNNATKQYKGYKYEHHKNNEINSSLGPEPGDFPEGIVEAPVSYNDPIGKVSLDLKFKAGFMGYEQNQKTLALSPTIGWYIQS